MKKTIFLLLVCILAIVSLAVANRFLPERITGLAAGNASVSVGEDMEGRVTAFLFSENLEFRQPQRITVEFTNIGSLNFSEKIELRIYYNQNGRLQLVAYYFDTENILKPSMSRTYSVNFYPPIYGAYYIRFRVSYGGQILEVWKAFLVTYTPPQPPIEIVYPPAAPAPAPPAPETGTPRMTIEYPDSLEITQGDTKMFGITVKNTGGISLTNLGLSTSTTNLISVEINPKQVFRLYPNDTFIFLISVTVPKETPGDYYPFEFEVICNQLQEARRINIAVVSLAKPAEEDLHQTILSYEYMISETQNEIDAASLRDVDTSQAQDSLNNAKTELDWAKLYYRQNRYDDVRSSLDKVKKYLEDAVYQLSVAGIVTEVPAFANWIIILVAIILGVFFVILFARRRRKKEEKEERPKILREMAEGET